MNRADCEFVDRWLDAWVAGQLPPDASRRLEAHLPSCDRCRQLEGIVRAANAESAWAETPGDDPADASFVSSVLTKTSGGACAQAEMLLPDLVDGALERSRAELLGEHVARCSRCARLLDALVESSKALAALVDTEPPLGFATRVLAATSRATRRSPIAEWWLRVLARPRASVELAYVGALIIVVLVGNPVAAFHGAEVHARRLVAAVPVERVSAELPLASGAIGMVGSAVRALTNEVRAIRSELSYRWQQANALLATVRAVLGDAANWIVNFDWRHPFTGAAHTLQPANKAPPTAQPPQEQRPNPGTRQRVYRVEDDPIPGRFPGQEHGR